MFLVLVLCVSVNARFAIQSVNGGAVGLVDGGDIGGSQNNTAPCGSIPMTLPTTRIALDRGASLDLSLEIVETWANVEAIEFSRLEGTGVDFSDASLTPVDMGTTNCGDVNFPCSTAATYPSLLTDTVTENGKVYTMQVYFPANGGYYQCVEFLAKAPEFGDVTEAALSALYVNGQSVGAIGPTMSVSVGNAVASVDILAVSTSQIAAIDLDGDDGTTLAVTKALAVAPDNTFTINVTSQDTGTFIQYTLIIERRAVSTNANLASLVLDGLYFNTLTPVFSPGQLTYSADADDLTSVTVTVASEDTAVSDVQIDGASALTRTRPVSVPSVDIVVVVTAEDGVSTNTYTITVTARAVSSVSELLSVRVHGNVDDSIAPPFDPLNSGPYSVALFFSEEFVAITASPMNAAASVNLDGQVRTSMIKQTSVGAQTVTIISTAEDGATTSTYTFTVTRASVANTNPLLAPATGLTLRGLQNNALTPPFSPATTEYTATAGFNDDVVTVETITQELISVVRINGVASRDELIPLAYGANTVEIEVTAENGDFSFYSMVITRLEPAGQADASRIEVVGLLDGSLDPVFSPTTFTYNVSAGLLEERAALIVSSSDPDATVSIDGIERTSRIAVLAYGWNTFAVHILAQNLIVSRTYTVMIFRQPPSTNANLQSIVVNGIDDTTLTPAFNSDVLAYDVTARFDEGLVSFDVVVEQPDATVMIDGIADTSAALNLNPGGNTLTIVVTAQDGLTTKTYVITVNQISASILADLDTIVLSGISSPALTPAFAPSITEYSALAGPDDTSVLVTVTTASAYASSTINGVASGSELATLSRGDNAIAIVVTAEDTAESTTYTVNVRRPLSVATLTSLELAGLTMGDLTPPFNASIFAYSATAEHEDSSVAVNAVLSDPGASILFNGNTSFVFALALGGNTINVAVIAEDGITNNTYAIVVNRNGPREGPPQPPVVEDEGESVVGPVIFGIGTLLYMIGFCMAACCIAWKVKEDKKIRGKGATEMI